MVTSKTDGSHPIDCTCHDHHFGCRSQMELHQPTFGEHTYSWQDRK